MTDAIHKIPLLRTTMAVGIGMLIVSVLPIGMWIEPALLGVYLAVFCLLLYFRRHWKYPRYEFLFGTLTGLGLACLGGMLLTQGHRHTKNLAALPNHHTWFVGEVIDYPLANGGQVNVKIQQYMDSAGVILPTTWKAILRIKDPGKDFTLLTPGCNVAFRGRILRNNPPINPRQFNYQKYLEDRGIAGTFFLSNADLHIRTHPNSFQAWKYFAKRMQHKGTAIFDSFNMGEDQKGIAAALILGNRSNIQQDVLKSFTDAGVVHVLAVSGLHVGIIYAVILLIINKLLLHRRWRFLRLAIVLGFLGFYAALTGFSPSVLRSAVMFGFLAIGTTLGRKGNSFNLLAASALFLLILNPPIVRQVGFQLSYAAVIGILYFQPRIKRIFSPKNFVIKWLWEVVAVTLAAQLTTLPLIFYYFGQFPNYFLLANPLVILLATFALYTGIIALIVSWIPWVSTLVAWVLNLLLWCLNSFVDTVSSLPFATTSGISFTMLAVLLSFIVMVLAVRVIHYPRGNLKWITMGVLMALSAMRVYTQVNAVKVSQIAVIEGPSSPLIYFQSGQESYLIPANGDMGQELRSGFYTDGFLRGKSIRPPIWLSPDSIFYARDISTGNGMVQVHHLVFSLSSSAGQRAENFEPNYSILEDSFGIHQLDALSGKPVYILSRTMRPHVKEPLLEALYEKNISVYDLSQMGILLL